MRWEKPQLIRLGNTNILTSGLGLGCCFDRPEDPPVDIILTAYYLGIDYFDTAPVYNTEWCIGELIKTRCIDRHKIYISTKTKATNRDELQKSIENSLKQLNTDYIDILWFHSYLDTLEQYETLLSSGLFAEVDRKVVKYIGISGHDLEAARRAVEDGVVHAIMVPHNILYRDFETIIKKANMKGIGVVTMKNFASGLLLGGPENRFGDEIIKELLNYELIAGANLVIPSARSINQLKQIYKLFNEDYEDKNPDVIANYLKELLGDDVCVNCHMCRPCKIYGWSMSQPRILKLYKYFTKFNIPKAKIDYNTLKYNFNSCIEAECKHCDTITCPNGEKVYRLMEKAHRVLFDKWGYNDKC